MRYADIREELHTGDIVLFEGRGAFSWAIQKLQRNQGYADWRWTHVGMIIVEPWGKLIWESGAVPGLNDVDTGISHIGPQVLPFSDRVRLYDGKRMAIRHLTGVTWTDPMLHVLGVLRHQFRKRPYEWQAWDLLSAVLADNPRWGPADLTGIFCSEMVSEILHRVLILSMDRPADTYVPAHYGATVTLPLLQGHLGPELEVVWG